MTSLKASAVLPSAGQAGAAAPAVPAPPSCIWLHGCDEPATDHELCTYHAHVCAEEIHEHERGDMETER